MTGRNPRGQRTALYRHFDAAGDLLYVGITYRPEGRHSEHGRSAVWYDDAVKTSVEWFDTREEAEAAEKRAIHSEAPRHNKGLRPRIDRSADPSTVGGICDHLGRANIARCVGVHACQVSAAIAANLFPARWFVLVRGLCEEAELSCPESLFNFAVAATTLSEPRS